MKNQSMMLSVSTILLLSACASATRGTSQAFQVETDPPGASIAFIEKPEVDKSGKAKKLQQNFRPATCMSPCAIKAKRKPGFVVKITKEGYEALEANIASAVSSGGGAGMAGNVLLGGVVGAIVDGSNGSMNDLKPNPLKVKLVKIEPVAPAATAPVVPSTAISTETQPPAPVATPH